MYKIFSILFAVMLFPLFAKSIAIKPDTILILKFPALPKSLYYNVTGEFPTTLASVYLPTDFDENKKHPVVLWIDGGLGGAGDLVNQAKKYIGSEGFILINLPLFKENLPLLKADSSNYWQRLLITNSDANITWNAYKIMLDSINKLFPQIDKNNAFMGGFSNGGHTTSILLNRPKSEITQYFTKFFFIEGGLGLKKYAILKNRSVLYMQGIEEKQNAWVKSFYNKAVKCKAKAQYFYMDGAGHSFPESYFDEFREWLKKNCEK